MYDVIVSSQALFQCYVNIIMAWIKLSIMTVKQYDRFEKEKS